MPALYSVIVGAAAPAAPASSTIPSDTATTQRRPDPTALSFTHKNRTRHSVGTRLRLTMATREVMLVLAPARCEGSSALPLLTTSEPIHDPPHPQPTEAKARTTAGVTIPRRILERLRYGTLERSRVRPTAGV